MSVVNFAKTANIIIEDIPYQQVLDRALKQFMSYQKSKGNYSAYVLTRSHTNEHTRNIIINYVRHEYTNYNDLVLEIERRHARQGNTKMAINILRDRANKKIRETYNI